MATRLWHQSYLANFPYIGRVRIWPDPNKASVAIVYLEDQEGNFGDYIHNVVIPKFKEFAMCHIEFIYKPYNQIFVDNIPPEPELPDYIKQLALTPGSNATAIVERLQKAFPDITPINLVPQLEAGEIGVEIKKVLRPERMKEIELYGAELVPLGQKFKLFYKH